MSAHFYFRKGFSFGEWHRVMGTICGFDINPVGSPLGEEITRADNFKEACCKLWLRFPGLSGVYRTEVTLRSIPNLDTDSPLTDKWNKAQDSLIHYVRMGFYEHDLIPSYEDEWEQWMPVAKHIYQLYKRMFLAFNCDEAKGTPDCSDIFYWTRGTDQQRVIFAYEDDRLLTLHEFENTMWCGQRDTALVFPQLKSGASLE